MRQNAGIFKMDYMLVIRPELLQALFKLWEVDNVDDLFRKTLEYELDKRLTKSLSVANDPTLTVFYEPEEDDSNAISIG